MRFPGVMTVAFLLGTLSGNVVVAQADTDKPVRQLGLKVHQGFVLVHSRELRPIGDSYPTGIELDYAWQKTSSDAWESCHCYSKVGFALTGWTYDNPEVLGFGLTGMFFLEPVFAAWRGVSYSIRAAFGLSYQNRPHNPVSNPDNLSYSTYVAFPLQLGASMHIRLSPQWNLDISAFYNHFSNGGIREPNKGVNWPTAAIGFGHYLQDPAFINRNKKNWREDGPPATRLDLSFFMGFNEPESKLFLFNPGIEVKYSRQISRLNALTLGAEWLVDNDDRYEMEQEGIDKGWNKVSLALGNEFLLGRFLFSQQFGVYLYKPHRSGTDVYQRYGLVYRITPRFQAGINLKAHGHVADFLDFRFGYSLKFP